MTTFARLHGEIAQSSRRGLKREIRRDDLVDSATRRDNRGVSLSRHVDVEMKVIRDARLIGDRAGRLKLRSVGRVDRAT